jgi:PKD repeat protein
MFAHNYAQAGNYPARLTVKDSAGQTSTPTQLIISVSPTIPQVVSVVSRKVHGLGGKTFDLTLPRGGTHAVECRSGGPNNEYMLVFTFNNPLVSVASATASPGAGGAGTVDSGAIGTDKHQYIVNLKGVSGRQVLTVTLNTVHDMANHIGTITQQFDILVGDTNGDRTVNSADIIQTKAQSGRAVTQTNFREDLNADGSVNSADISLVKLKSGTALSP